MVERYIPVAERYAELYVLLFPNGKRYFGITKDVKNRIKGHCKRAHSRASKKLPVHCAVSKYGIDTIQVKVLAVGYRQYIADLEIRMIAAYQTTNREFGYNWSVGGERGPMLGKTFSHSPETKAKMSKIAKVRGMSAACLEASRRNRKPPSAKTRAIWSAQRKLIVRTPEWCANISAGKTGKRRSKSDCEAMRIRMTGTKFSAETRAKMAASQQKRRERKRQLKVV